MELVGGPLGVAAIGVAAVLVIALAVLHFRFHIFRRRKGRGRHRPGAPGAGSSRIEILESKTIDGDRKLVLVRCDDVEHLIVVGGPADVVVENDVRKVRGPSTSTPQRSPMMEPAKRAATAAWQSSSTMAEAPAAARPADSSRPPRPTPEPRSVTAAAPRAPSVAQPLGQAGAGNASRPESAAQNRPPAQRSPADSAVARRDGQPPRRAAPNGPSPVNPRGTEPHRSPVTSSERPTRQAARGATPSSGLPAAQIPWSDPDSIESEIVRALRFDPRIRPPGASAADGRRELSTAKSLVDSSTTLGDLADRLEEALAREVQSATPARSPEVNIQDFGFEPQAERPAIEQPLAPLEREDRRERIEPQKLAAKTVMAPAPEPEPRREASPPPERREETPVISLNSRRREAADPLEDEMARLLGELTSDTKGR